jgi:hypothetical protein
VLPAGFSFPGLQHKSSGVSERRSFALRASEISLDRVSLTCTQVGGLLMNRIRFLWTAILLLVFAGSVFAQDTKFPPQDEQIPGPDKS